MVHNYSPRYPGDGDRRIIPDKSVRLSEKQTKRKKELGAWLSKREALSSIPSTTKTKKRFFDT
jgi:hypothetical protein